MVPCPKEVAVSKTDALPYSSAAQHGAYLLGHMLTLPLAPVGLCGPSCWHPHFLHGHNLLCSIFMTAHTGAAGAALAHEAYRMLPLGCNEHLQWSKLSATELNGTSFQGSMLRLGLCVQQWFTFKFFGSLLVWNFGTMDCMEQQEALKLSQLKSQRPDETFILYFCVSSCRFFPSRHLGWNAFLLFTEAIWRSMWLLLHIC